MSTAEFLCWTLILALLLGFIGYGAYNDDPAPPQLSGGCY